MPPGRLLRLPPEQPERILQASLRSTWICWARRSAWSVT